MASLCASLGVANAATQTTEGAARRVTDETGRGVTLPGEIRRIVSLAPNLTETLFALGLGDRVVGVSEYSDYPEAAKTKPSVGAPLEPSLEQIVALRPDVVLVTKALNRRETVAALERLGLAVYATDPRTVEGTVDSIARLGELLGAPEQGRTVAASLRARLAALAAKLAGAPPVRVAFVVWEQPLISIGPHTFLAAALEHAGAESVIVSRQDWPRVSVEELIRLEPDALIYAGAADGPQPDLAGMRARPGWRSLRAVEQGRVVTVSEAITRPAPRMIDAIEELARKLHPERFTDPEKQGYSKQQRVPVLAAGFRAGGAPCVR